MTSVVDYGIKKFVVNVFVQEVLLFFCVKLSGPDVWFVFCSSKKNDVLL